VCSYYKDEEEVGLLEKFRKVVFLNLWRQQHLKARQSQKHVSFYISHMVINPLYVYPIYITFHAFFRVTNVLASSLQPKVRQRTLWLTSGSWFGSKTVE